jgi:hypothetical protein
MQLSKSRLAIVPGYNHYNFITSPEAPEIICKFLDDLLTTPVAGAAAASQTAVGPQNLLRNKINEIYSTRRTLRQRYGR